VAFLMVFVSEQVLAKANRRLLLVEGGLKPIPIEFQRPKR